MKLSIKIVISLTILVTAFSLFALSKRRHHTSSPRQDPWRSVGVYRNIYGHNIPIKSRLIELTWNDRIEGRYLIFQLIAAGGREYGAMEFDFYCDSDLPDRFIFERKIPIPDTGSNGREIRAFSSSAMRSFQAAKLDAAMDYCETD